MPLAPELAPDPAGAVGINGFRRTGKVLAVSRGTDGSNANFVLVPSGVWLELKVA
jgi:hypothetical protein